MVIMKNEIIEITENKDGHVFTISRVINSDTRLSPEIIDNLVSQGMDREQAERMTPASTTIRIMRSPHMDADVPVDDATKAMIDCIKNMPKK